MLLAANYRTTELQGIAGFLLKGAIAFSPFVAAAVSLRVTNWVVENLTNQASIYVIVALILIDTLVVLMFVACPLLLGQLTVEVYMSG